MAGGRRARADSGRLADDGQGAVAGDGDGRKVVRQLTQTRIAHEDAPRLSRASKKISVRLCVLVARGCDLLRSATSSGTRCDLCAARHACFSLSRPVSPRSRRRQARLTTRASTPRSPARARPAVDAIPAIKADGFKAIINLRLASEEGADVRARLGKRRPQPDLKYIHIPFSGSDPKSEAVDQFLAATKDPGASLRCSSTARSANRAAMMWLIKRVVVDGWPVEKATAEAERAGLTNRPSQSLRARVPEGARQGLMAGSRDRRRRHRRRHGPRGVPSRRPSGRRLARRLLRAPRTVPGAGAGAARRSGQGAAIPRARRRPSRSTRSSTTSPGSSSPASRTGTIPGFFAYFAISGSGPGVLAEMLAAGLNVQAMLWRTSPSATELEEVALGWLRDLMQLPPAFEGVIYDTASVAVLHALAAAREAVDPGRPHEGPSGPARPAARARVPVGPHPLVGGQVGDPAGAGKRRDRAHPVRRPARDARGSAARGHRRRSPRRHRAAGRHRHNRHDLVDGHRSGATRSRICARPRASGSTSMRPMRA